MRAPVSFTMASLNPPEPKLSDGVITLRPFTPADVPVVTLACQDPELSRWTAQVPWPYTENDAIEWISRHRAMWSEGRGAPFAIVDQNGQLLGAISLNPVDWSSLEAGVGYWVAHWARKGGVATRALELVVIWAFQALGLTTLKLETMLGNVASERVAAKAGFQMVGVQKGWPHPIVPDMAFDVKHWVKPFGMTAAR